MATRGTLYVLCIDDGDYPESLDVRKVYTVVPDTTAEHREYIRIVDETGEDYLYPAKLFIPIHLPPEAVRALTTNNTRNSGSR